MGKDSPIGSASAAAPFTPESESLRVKAKQENSASTVSASGWSLPTKGPGELPKSGDSTGNPNSFPYQGPPQSQGNPTATPLVNPIAAKPDAPTAPPPRFQAGWDKLLVVQKNICHKAMNLLLLFEAPQRYFAATRTKTAARKYKGIILDYKSADIDEDENKDREAG